MHEHRGQNAPALYGEKGKTRPAKKLIDRLRGIAVIDREQRARNEHDGNRPPAALLHIPRDDPAKKNFFEHSGQHRDHENRGQQIPPVERGKRTDGNFIPDFFKRELEISVQFRK